MTITHTRTLALLPATLLLTASLQGASAQAVPANWNSAALASSTFVILDPQIQGNPNVVSAQQRQGVLEAMKRDSAGAIKRRYPNAVIAADPATPGAVQVRPVLVTPSVLAPWNKLTAQLEFRMPAGNNVILKQDFGVLTLWQKQAEAANYMYDVLAQRLP
ncbi:hypothetical protein GCM10008959_16120 [Deinococcus seoulensis]|uniref:Uncharacterized protein n=1 Tax=Deinococcus seoulensis TaxID=1837379 RepID=A0ABQ2RTN5_9DEIO|nr:hypothetical protein [Deinococcus seoulensis]GGR55290.1 hypothetical protein GCM10008959_16120 [Deinococcus seoulensis]